MCGRLNEKIDAVDWEAALQRLGIKDIPDPPDDPNTAPTAKLPVVMDDDGERALHFAYWGYMPGSKYSTINARAETLDEKPLYRKAFAERRGVIVADSFYEWDKSQKPSQPYRILRKDEKPIYLAALYTYRKEDPKLACTIVTTGANTMMETIHHRMPVVLDLAEAEAWLDPGSSATLLKRMIAPHDWPDMDAYQIGTQINKPANKNAEIINPL